MVKNNPIRQEQIRILYANTMIAVAGSLTVAIITAVALYPHCNLPILLGWLLAEICLAAYRWHDYNVYNQKSRNEQDEEHFKWGRRFVLASACNGTLWGLVLIILHPPDIQLFSLVLIVHAGYIAGAASSTAIYMPAFASFVATSSMLLLTGTIYHRGIDSWIYATLIAVYAIIVTLFALRNNRSVVEQISLRLENQALTTNLREQRDRSEHAMLAKNRFLAAASHDLRQPVHALGLFVASLETRQGFEERQHILTKIKQSTEALGGLFHGLLDISKLDANVIENNPEHFPMSTLLNLMKSQFQHTADAKSLILNIDTNTDLVAFVDPGLLERILRNLIDNAINYTDIGSISIDITDSPDDRLVLSVTDTGKGIPASEQDNIFSEYHQLENPERNRQKGLGLGLAIVRRLCDLMNITINVDSQQGQGSMFSLAIHEGDRKRIKPLAPVSTVSSQIMESRPKLNVVVIDDELDIIDGMKRILGSWSCNTIAATTTKAALYAMGDEFVPDIIIADFRLGENKSGLDAIRLIREEFNEEVPSILVTGDTAPERLQQAAAASIQVLFKPVEPSRLRRALETIVGYPVVDLSTKTTSTEAMRNSHISVE